MYFLNKQTHKLGIPKRTNLPLLILSAEQTSEIKAHMYSRTSHHNTNKISYVCLNLDSNFGGHNQQLHSDENNGDNNRERVFIGFQWFALMALTMDTWLCSDTMLRLSARERGEEIRLEVWAKEREAAGLKASLTTLMSEVQRLNMLCEERKEAEDSLKKKWKKIEEFDARRLELKSIYIALMRANKDVAAFWSQQPFAARERASNTIIPACRVVVGIAKSAKDLIDKEVSAFSRSPDNSPYMLPSTPQGLLESMGPNGSTGPEALAAAEKNASLLTARAGAGDPFAIPSICRVSAALQYPAGLEGSEAGLASVLESMEFCLKLHGSEACVLEDLSKAINLVHIRRDLVESGHAILNHAYHAQNEYKRTTSYCLDMASEQEEIIMEKWLPELKNGVVNAQRSLNDCKYVSGLLDEWWEQPASTVVDWVTVDGKHIVAWHNHVKKLLAFYDKELL